VLSKYFLLNFINEHFYIKPIGDTTPATEK